MDRDGRRTHFILSQRGDTPTQPSPIEGEGYRDSTLVTSALLLSRRPLAHLVHGLAVAARALLGGGVAGGLLDVLVLLQVLEGGGEGVAAAPLTRGEVKQGRGRATFTTSPPGKRSPRSGG